MRYIRSISIFHKLKNCCQKKSANIVEILLEINYILPWCLCRKRLWGHKNKNSVDRQYQSQDLVYVTSILYPDSTSFPREEGTSNIIIYNGSEILAAVKTLAQLLFSKPSIPKQKRINERQSWMQAQVSAVHFTAQMGNHTRAQTTARMCSMLMQYKSYLKGTTEGSEGKCI